MYTRKDYMAGACDHQTYYGQFATPAVVALVAGRIGVDRIKNSKNEHFNDIPLIVWDQLAPIVRSYVGGKIGESNATTYANGTRTVSLSDCICTAKAAAAKIRGF